MFPSPSAKKKVSSAPGNPLPIPLEGWGGVPSSPWPVYAAQLVDGEVLVTEARHVAALHNNGFFGHGLLSNKGLDYTLFSKKLTQPQMSRKIQWRSMEVSAANSIMRTGSRNVRSRITTKNNPECRIPKKYVYVIPDEPSGEFEGDAPTNTHAGGGTRGDSAASLLMLDPYPVEECLVLLPEEAVFLSLCLCCLVVSDEAGTELSIDSLWQRLTAEEPALPYRYAAYHALRSEGWVVKGAARYSADYMLYAAGPLYYHSQYLVRVEGYDAVTRAPLTSCHTRRPEDLNVLDRLAANVQKMFMLCIVLRPPSLSSLDNVRDCLQKLRVEQLPFAWLNIDTVDNADDGDQEY